MSEQQNLFEAAIRGKFRFPTTKGLLTAEDLLDLSEPALDKIWQTLNAELKVAQNESLAASLNSRKTKEQTQTAQKADLVKVIYLEKVAAREAASALATKRAEARQKLATLEAIAAQKQYEALSTQSETDLAKMIAEAKAALAE